jgi:hypothetical protein
VGERSPLQLKEVFDILSIDSNKNEDENFPPGEHENDLC